MSIYKVGFIILASAILVCISYFYFDRQLVDAMHSANARQYHFLHYIQQLPEPLLYLAPLGISFSFIQDRRKRVNKTMRYTFTAGVAILIASGIKILLKFCFGRYWPDTFKENNVSYLCDGAYGFNPFNWGVQYDSFPSGHMITMVTFSIVTMAFYPNVKWVCIPVCTLVALGLLILYYHFLGDVIAGTAIGWLMGNGAMTFAKKRQLV